MAKSAIILLCGLITMAACSSPKTTSDRIEIPRRVEESSGLALWGDHFLTFNDSGGAASLYTLSRKGELLETHPIEGAINRDWEDITEDENHYYIADTGNNFANRQDLTLYITDKNLQLLDSIKISYARQTVFKARKKHEFDAEALVNYGDSLLLFSKNRKTLTTELYLIPKTPGDYSLTPRTHFEVNALITGGDYRPENQTLVLTGYLPDYTQYLLVAENFDMNRLDEVVFSRHPLALDNAQVEAVKITDDNRLWISSEGEGFNIPFLLPLELPLENAPTANQQQ
ncbi:MAG: hypothetical protein ACPIA1_03040 [Flavobacteriaceae bacterium]